MSSLQPRPPYTGEELSVLYPRNLELRQVQILLRHGERTPSSTRFQSAGLAGYWPYCTVAKQMKSVVLGTDNTLTWRRRLESFSSDDSPITSIGPQREADAICQPGELTDEGRATTLWLGQRIRKLYVEQLSFLPEVLDDPAQRSIRIRASPVPRALESVQQVFVGLYPAGQRAPGLPPPTIVQRSMADEILFPNDTACKRLAELEKDFAERAAKRWNDSPEMGYINQKIGKWMPEESPVVRVDSHPRLVGIMDTINATRAHGPATRLPAEFYDAKVLSSIDRICTEEWYAGYEESSEYRRLGVGPLLGDLGQHMVENACGTSVRGEEAFRFSLAGCHDTTLAATLTSLGGFSFERDQWPRFTSSIAFELFRSRDELGTPSPHSHVTGAPWPSREKTWWFSLFSSPKPTDSDARAPVSSMLATTKRRLDGHYVRVRYNDKPVTLPLCAAPGRHLPGDPSFCTLEAFKEIVDASTPKAWRAECARNLGAPGIPAKQEPPPGVSIDRAM